jgi:CheY-like chemotaxis protein
MHPYLHPTTLLVLDDDPYYVESFKFHFGDQFPCVSYTQPERAIEHLLSQEKLRPTFDNLLQRATSSGQVQQGQPETASRGAEQVKKIINDPNRFRRVSVVVVDFDMPAMTGVQVCRALHHLPVRKLLLTGKAGVDTAISAFNEGVIDTFLTKHDPEIQKTLPRQVLRLQEEYFKATTEALGTAMARQEAGFLIDRGIQEAVAAIVKSRRIVEHYALGQPNGLLLVDHAGAAMVYLVMDAESLRAHWEVARDNGAPAALLDLLASMRAIPAFPTASGYFEKELGATWSRHLHPAQRIDTDAVWYTALLSGDQAAHIVPARLSSYAAFEDSQAAGASGQSTN